MTEFTFTLMLPARSSPWRCFCAPPTGYLAKWKNGVFEVARARVVSTRSTGDALWSRLGVATPDEQRPQPFVIMAVVHAVDHEELRACTTIRRCC
jgi:hypothetical protein